MHKLSSFASKMESIQVYSYILQQAGWTLVPSLVTTFSALFVLFWVLKRRRTQRSLAGSLQFEVQNSQDCSSKNKIIGEPVILILNADSNVEQNDTEPDSHAAKAHSPPTVSHMYQQFYNTTQDCTPECNQIENISETNAPSLKAEDLKEISRDKHAIEGENNLLTNNVETNSVFGSVFRENTSTGRIEVEYSRQSHRKAIDTENVTGSSLWISASNEIDISEFPLNLKTSEMFEESIGNFDESTKEAVKSISVEFGESVNPETPTMRSRAVFNEILDEVLFEAISELSVINKMKGDESSMFIDRHYNANKSMMFDMEEIVTQDESEIILQDKPEIIHKSEIIDQFKQEIIIQAEPDIVSQMKQEIVTQGESEIVIQDKPEIMLQDKSEIIDKFKQEIIIQAEPYIVSQMKQEIVTHGESEIVSQDKPQMISQDEQGMFIQYEPEIVSQNNQGIATQGKSEVIIKNSQGLVNHDKSVNENKQVTVTQNESDTKNNKDKKIINKVKSELVSQSKQERVLQDEPDINSKNKQEINIQDGQNYSTATNNITYSVTNNMSEEMSSQDVAYENNKCVFITEIAQKVSENGEVCLATCQETYLSRCIDDGIANNSFIESDNESARNSKMRVKLIGSDETCKITNFNLIETMSPLRNIDISTTKGTDNDNILKKYDNYKNKYDIHKPVQSVTQEIISKDMFYIDGIEDISNSKEYNINIKADKRMTLPPKMSTDSQNGLNVDLIPAKFYKQNALKCNRPPSVLQAVVNGDLSNITQIKKNNKPKCSNGNTKNGCLKVVKKRRNDAGCANMDKATAVNRGSCLTDRSDPANSNLPKSEDISLTSVEKMSSYEMYTMSLNESISEIKNVEIKTKNNKSTKDKRSGMRNKTAEQVMRAPQANGQNTVDACLGMQTDLNNARECSENKTNVLFKRNIDMTKKQVRIPLKLSRNKEKITIGNIFRRWRRRIKNNLDSTDETQDKYQMDAKPLKLIRAQKPYPSTPAEDVKKNISKQENISPKNKIKEHIYVAIKSNDVREIPTKFRTNKAKVIPSCLKNLNMDKIKDFMEDLIKPGADLTLINYNNSLNNVNLKNQNNEFAMVAEHRRQEVGFTARKTRNAEPAPAIPSIDSNSPNRENHLADSKPQFSSTDASLKSSTKPFDIRNPLNNVQFRFSTILQKAENVKLHERRFDVINPLNNICLNVYRPLEGNCLQEETNMKKVDKDKTMRVIGKTELLHNVSRCKIDDPFKVSLSENMKDNKNENLFKHDENLVYNKANKCFEEQLDENRTIEVNFAKMQSAGPPGYEENKHSSQTSECYNDNLEQNSLLRNCSVAIRDTSDSNTTLGNNTSDWSLTMRSNAQGAVRTVHPLKPAAEVLFSKANIILGPSSNLNSPVKVRERVSFEESAPNLNHVKDVFKNISNVECTSCFLNRELSTHRYCVSQHVFRYPTIKHQIETDSLSMLNVSLSHTVSFCWSPIHISISHQIVPSNVTITDRGFQYPSHITIEESKMDTLININIRSVCLGLKDEDLDCGHVTTTSYTQTFPRDKLGLENETMLTSQDEIRSKMPPKEAIDSDGPNVYIYQFNCESPKNNNKNDASVTEIMSLKSINRIFSNATDMSEPLKEVQYNETIRLIPCQPLEVPVAIEGEQSRTIVAQNQFSGKSEIALPEEKLKIMNVKMVDDSIKQQTTANIMNEIIYNLNYVPTQYMRRATSLSEEEESAKNSINNDCDSRVYVIATTSVLPRTFLTECSQEKQNRSASDKKKEIDKLRSKFERKLDSKESHHKNKSNTLAEEYLQMMSRDKQDIFKNNVGDKNTSETKHDSIDKCKMQMNGEDISYNKYKNSIQGTLTIAYFLDQPLSKKSQIPYIDKQPSSKNIIQNYSNEECEDFANISQIDVDDEAFQNETTYTSDNSMSVARKINENLEMSSTIIHESNNIIPGIIQDVTVHNIKRLMRDLVKPCADLPWDDSIQELGLEYKPVHTAESTPWATHYMKNTTCNTSAVRFEPIGHKFRKSNHLNQSSIKSSVSSKAFDPNNPVNNIHLAFGAIHESREDGQSNRMFDVGNPLNNVCLNIDKIKPVPNKIKTVPRTITIGPSSIFGSNNDNRNEDLKKGTGKNQNNEKDINSEDTSALGGKDKNKKKKSVLSFFGSNNDNRSEDLKKGTGKNQNNENDINSEDTSAQGAKDKNKKKKSVLVREEFTEMDRRMESTEPTINNSLKVKSIIKSSKNKTKRFKDHLTGPGSAHPSNTSVTIRENLTKDVITETMFENYSGFWKKIAPLPVKNKKIKVKNQATAPINFPSESKSNSVADDIGKMDGGTESQKFNILYMFGKKVNNEICINKPNTLCNKQSLKKYLQTFCNSQSHQTNEEICKRLLSFMEQRQVEDVKKIHSKSENTNNHKEESISKLEKTYSRRSTSFLKKSGTLKRSAQSEKSVTVNKSTDDLIKSLYVMETEIQFESEKTPEVKDAPLEKTMKVQSEKVKDLSSVPRLKSIKIEKPISPNTELETLKRSVQSEKSIMVNKSTDDLLKSLYVMETEIQLKSEKTPEVKDVPLEITLKTMKVQSEKVKDLSRVPRLKSIKIEKPISPNKELYQNDIEDIVILKDVSGGNIDQRSSVIDAKEKQLDPKTDVQADVRNPLILKIESYSFMGTWGCQWEQRTSNEWSFLLLHGRIRLRINFPDYERVYLHPDTPVLAARIEYIDRGDREVAAHATTACMISLSALVRAGACARAADVPAMLSRCARVVGAAAHWARTMQHASAHLGYALNQSRLTLQIANVPLRSVWDVSLAITCEPRGPRASDVRVAAVCSDVEISPAYVDAILRDVSHGWDNVPQTVWKLYNHLKYMTRDHSSAQRSEAEPSSGIDRNSAPCNYTSQTSRVLLS